MLSLADTIAQTLRRRGHRQCPCPLHVSDGHCTGRSVAIAKAGVLDMAIFRLLYLGVGSGPDGLTTIAILPILPCVINCATWHQTAWQQRKNSMSTSTGLRGAHGKPSWLQVCLAGLLGGTVSLPSTQRGQIPDPSLWRLRVQEFRPGSFVAWDPGADKARIPSSQVFCRDSFSFD